MPNVNHTTSENANLSRLIASWPPSKLLLTLMVESITKSRTAIRSSTTSTAVTVPVNFCCFSFKSSNDLMMMVVDDMESMQPRNMQFIELQPSRCPTMSPMVNISSSSVNAVIAPVPPTFFSFLMLNSRPRANMRNTMPMSLHTWILASSVMAGNHGK